MLVSFIGFLRAVSRTQRFSTMLSWFLVAFPLTTAWPVISVAQTPGISLLCADRTQATGSRSFLVPTIEYATQTGTPPDLPASDLSCIDLFSTANGENAFGVIELVRPWSPFGVTVTPEGHHRHHLKGWISGLPDPATLGPYQTYVAWATPLELDPIIKLGAVTDGENDLGEVSFNKFMVLITAEPSPEVDERSGPLILRGRSPSSRMEAHDLMTLAPSAEMGQVEIDTVDDGWELPPMYEGVPMLPGVMATQPRSSPLLITSTTEIPGVEPSEIVELPDGGTLDLFAGLVRRKIQGTELTMLAFNNQHPGPLIKVAEGSTIFVNFINETPLPTAVHWHGVRLDNRYDGVPGLTQDPVLPGKTFRYQVHFKDAGIYWYHPHHREDLQQELGLAGNMLVEPISPDYYSPVNRDEVVMLDDLVLTEDGITPFGLESPNYMLMGRFGNVFLTNGEPDYRLETQAGEVVRFHFTNASNTRTFNLSFHGQGSPDANLLPIKVVGSDLGKFEHEVIVNNVVLAPAERYVVEVFFDEAGTYALMNHVQGINHRMGVFLEESRKLGSIEVARHRTEFDHHHAFETLRTNPDVIADIDRYRSDFNRPIDHELVLTLLVDSLPPAIEQSMLYDRAYFNPVEWTGTMPVMNWATTGAEVEWILRDVETSDENMDINWSFQVGDVIKVRIYNDRRAFHAMQHPLHIHGQRFLVLEQNGIPNNNLVWKDTVLLPAGSSTDILLELSNPGRWMVHCHIAEHLESGMKFVIDVEGN